MQRHHNGKLSAYKTQASPFVPLAHWSAWEQAENDAETVYTGRTLGYLIGYAILTGGRFSLSGIRLSDGYYRPDKWVLGALLKKGYVALDDTLTQVEITSDGWRIISQHL